MIVLFQHARNAPDQSVHARDMLFAYHGPRQETAGVLLSRGRHSGDQLVTSLTRAWSTQRHGTSKCIVT